MLARREYSISIWVCNSRASHPTTFTPYGCLFGTNATAATTNLINVAYTLNIYKSSPAQTRIHRKTNIGIERAALKNKQTWHFRCLQIHITHARPHNMAEAHSDIRTRGELRIRNSCNWWKTKKQNRRITPGARRGADTSRGDRRVRIEIAAMLDAGDSHQFTHTDKTAAVAALACESTKSTVCESVECRERGRERVSEWKKRHAFQTLVQTVWMKNHCQYWWRVVWCAAALFFFSRMPANMGFHVQYVWWARMKSENGNQ